MESDVTGPYPIYVGMAVAKALGFDLCPRLRDLAERKLFLPRSLEAPEGLDQVLCAMCP